MRFLELRLNHFGKFNNENISLKDGINLIYGENEAGKSTIHTFIRGMLFGIEKARGRASKDDIYGKYQPWDTPGAYSGSMDLETGGRRLRIYRSFDKNNKETTIIDLDTGRELRGFNENIQEFLEGLTEAGYRNTISIEQLKARTGQELADEVRNYITNLSLTKSNEVDVVKALGFLTTKRKELEAALPGDKIQKVRESIEEGLEKEARMDELTEKLFQLTAQEKVLIHSFQTAEIIHCPSNFSDVSAYEKYLYKLPVYEEKYSSYEYYYKQLEQTEKKIEILRAEIERARLSDSKEIAAGLDELTKDKLMKSELEDKKSSLLLKEQEEINGVKAGNIISTIVGIAGALLVILSFNKNLFLSVLGLVCVLQGVILYFMESHRKKKGKEQFQKSLDEIVSKIKDLENKCRNILLKYNAADERELKKGYEEVLRIELEVSHKKSLLTGQEQEKSHFKNQFQTLENEIFQYIGKLEGFLTKIKLEGKTVGISKDMMSHLREYVEGEISHLKDSKNLAIKQQEELNLKKERIKWELKSLEGYEDELLYHQKLLDTLTEREVNIKKELEAIRLAANTINQLSVDIHDSFGRELNKIVSNLTRETTAGKYSDIKVDEKLDIKILTGQQYVSIDKLSMGTMDQLYFAIRIAVSNLIYGENVMPLLFDDSFALYDDKRTRSVLNYLSGNKGQVLIFTCHNREKDILDRNQISYNYIDLGNN